jgi:hypothetical protein
MYAWWVLGLTQTAALEYAARGIRINAVYPGTIKTPTVQSMTGGDPKAMAEMVKDEPIGRLGEPEEIAAAVLWLSSPGASFVVGHALLVDGGPAPARAYIPELLDDVLEGHINPGRVFDFTTNPGGIAQAYAAMDERRAIKSLVKVGAI